MSFSALQDVSILRLDWKCTTTELFSFLSDIPWAIFLDSASTDHCDSHFDIICLDPIATLVTEGDSTEISRYRDHCLTSASISLLNPFDLIKQELAHYFPLQKSSEFPFSGGAMGSFNYDLGRKIEKIPEIAADDIELPTMNIGLYLWALIFDHKEQAWSLVHYGNEEAAQTSLAWIQAKLEIIPNKPSFTLLSDWQPQLTKADYEAKFNAIQEYIQSGDCYQINLTQRFSAKYQGNEWQAYLKLRESNKAPFSAFIRLSQCALLSISPERFIQLRGEDIQTKPIKGTSPRYHTAAQDQKSATQLRHSAKDRAENLMIVDLLRNDLGKVAKPGSVSVPHLFEIESFPAVHHLVSTVTAQLDATYDATDLLKACFPGGSITGAPKIRAMEIIEELEPSRRSIYCGSIGYISQDGQMDTSITIRTLVAIDGIIYCWAGGGIVDDSTAESEYKETYDKVSKILPVLQG
ncbi:aminodeoxychorismate synthase, subunit I [Shewanella psychrophila]|uniref:aminodeoxychorismate synthase n=1 Tax=Shewanella psychrophila TaxID=225848 RepID=A0A1S6HK95_9GAMM|nr:aminodeoxychorismate synthase component I [Shewanella psychrophila]AQS35951.1 aminodeoxychorismate synthase, subunit I [Shewanella psychrophila]